MRRFTFVPLVLLALACGSGSGTSRPSSVAKPVIEVGLTHDIFFGSQTQAPAEVAITVSNTAAEPIKLLRVEVYSPTMAQWWIRRITHTFNDTILPGQSKTVTLFATAETQVSRPDEPLTMTALLDFEAGTARWREHVITR